MSNDNKAVGDLITEYVTVMIGGQLFGLPISRVQDVFMPDRVDARAAVRSRDCRRAHICAGPHRDGDRHAPPARPAAAHRRQAVDGGRHRAEGESYGLLIDNVGEVMKLGEDTRESNPVNLDITARPRVRGRAPARRSTHGHPRR